MELNELIDCPPEAHLYEFIVAYKRDESLVFHSYFDNGFRAFATAASLTNGVVLHNVRISGRVR